MCPKKWIPSIDLQVNFTKWNVLERALNNNKNSYYKVSLMTRYTPAWERGPHGVVASDRAVRNVGCVCSREYHVILLHMQDNITGHHGMIVISTVTIRGSHGLTVEGYYYWHVLTSWAHENSPRKHINSLHGSSKNSGMFVVSVSNISHLVVIDKCVVRAGTVFVGWHVGIERDHALCGMWDNPDLYKLLYDIFKLHCYFNN